MIKRLLSVFIVILLLIGFCFAADEPFQTLLFCEDHSFNVGEDVIVSAKLDYLDELGIVYNFFNGSITANIDGKSLNNSTGGDGFVSFNFGKLSAGNYNVTFDYAGNESYESCNKSININVVPSGSNSSNISVNRSNNSVVDGESVGLSLTGFNLCLLFLLFGFLIVLLKYDIF
ncbi:MAG: Ig-like domain-containing protein [Methanobrevibacter sp.]|jgi:hypothetical protein|nr:Ig-like domain-containing protein [Candidatus Methanovirga australis]